MLYKSSYYGIAPLGQLISHHGIKGQKWGIRRFQNEDGSLTPAGRERYSQIVGNAIAFVGGSMFCVNKQTGRVFTKTDPEYKKLSGTRWIKLKI